LQVNPALEDEVNANYNTARTIDGSKAI